MRIAVIGATGNVGTAVLRRLQQVREENPAIELVGISRRQPSLDRAPYSGVEWHSADVGTDAGREKLTTALKGVDAVVHLAWAIQPNRDEDAMHRTNVIGTENALHAAADAGVRHFVCASSVGAYSPARKDETVTENWPTGGIATSHYSRHKAVQEDLLDAFERDFPEIPVARIRPGLIFQADAGEEIARYFLGPLIPRSILNKLSLPVLPIPSQLVFQAVHAADIADAYWRILDQRASGAFNIAADPILTPRLLGGLLGAKRVFDLPVSVLRGVVAASWALHIQATDPGWIDMAAQAPVMNTDRARTLLGWEPTRSSVEALREVIDGMAGRSGVHSSPSLRPGR